MFAGDVIDRLLAFLHAGDIIGEADPAVTARGAKARQLQDFVTARGILIEALFQDRAEIVPEGFVRRLVVIIGALAKFREHTLHQGSADLGQQRARLQHLAADVELQILAVHQAFHEAQPARQNLVRLIGDEDALGIELQRLLAFRVEEVEGPLRGNEQQSRVIDLALGLEMDRRPGFVEGMGGVAIEIAILLGRHLGFRFGPESRLLVDMLLVGAVFEMDRQRHMLGMLGDDMLKPRRFQPFAFSFLEVQRDLGAARGFLRRLDGELAGAVRHPAPALIFPRLARENRDLIRDHEGRIKADAELADQRNLGFRRFRLLQLLDKFRRAGAGDGAEMADKIVLIHADAVIGHGQGLRILVDGEGHGKVSAALQQFRLRQPQIAQLVAGIGCVRNKLAQEDRFIAVQRMRNHLQKAGNFSLKAVPFHGHLVSSDTRED